MKGSIFKRKGSTDTWTIVLELDAGADRKRRRAWYTVRGSYRDAQRKRTELLQAQQTGTYVEPNHMTVEVVLNKWIATKNDLAHKTRERYREIVKVHLIPALGHHLLEKLRPLDIQDYYAKARISGRKRKGGGPLAARTVLHHHRVLREALQQAVRWRLLTVNPADAVEAPRAARPEIHALDEADAANLIKLSADTRLEVPITLALTTGMRRGELLGIRWQDLDVDAGTLSVRQSLEHTKEAGLVFKAPKTGKGRSIDLGSIALDALRRHKLAQEREKRWGSAYDDHDLICAEPDGRPWHPDAMSSAYRKLLADHSLSGIRFHDLRHTHATHLLRQGVSPKVVAERLGHATVAMTLDTYSHVLPGMQADAATKVDCALRLAMESAS